MYNDSGWNRKPNERIGCDICKQDTPTERFDGYRKNVLWICSKCYKKVTNKKYTILFDIQCQK